MKAKFEEDDRVVYDGLVAIVDRVNTHGGRISYDLTSDVDPELTCTANEVDCEKYDCDNDLEQENTLKRIGINNRLMTQRIASTTYKHLRDGTH